MIKIHVVKENGVMSETVESCDDVKLKLQSFQDIKFSLSNIWSVGHRYVLLNPTFYMQGSQKRGG